MNRRYVFIFLCGWAFGDFLHMGLAIFDHAAGESRVLKDPALCEFAAGPFLDHAQAQEAAGEIEKYIREVLHIHRSDWRFVKEKPATVDGPKWFAMWFFDEEENIDTSCDKIKVYVQQFLPGEETAL